jgi:tetratricopeptide (TPR) repeat protein
MTARTLAGNVSKSRHRALACLQMRSLTTGLSAILLIVCPGPVRAQAGSGITERIESHSDPSKSFATFVPSSYRTDEPAPLVLVLDPRGRALVPLARMAPAAERLGYLVLSSYDSRSDESTEPNDQAVAAMIEDAQDLFNVDTRRLYFVGLSGTARASWRFGQRFVPHTAGIIGFGAALPDPTMAIALYADGSFPFAFYGGAGDGDFNYEEVRRLDENLDGFGAPHFVDEWEGPHAWPDEVVFTRALEWLDTQAIRSGLEQRSPVEVANRYARGLERARALESEARLLHALRTYRHLAADFRGLVEVYDAEAAVARLIDSAALIEARAQLREILDERREFDRRLGAWVERVRESKRVRDVERGVDDLELDELMKRAQAQHPLESAAAQRRLEAVYVNASFYEPADYLSSREYAIAEAYYRLAAIIHPEDPRTLLGLARTRAQLGRLEQSSAALEEAVASGHVTRAMLTDDPLLEPLRTDPRFRRLVATLRR